MSRSGYVDIGDCEHGELYRANVDRTLGSKRGQEFLRELAVAMDAMPEKILIAEELVSAHGECCTMGVVCAARGLNVSEVDPEDPERVGKLLGVSRMMAAEIAYMNDEWSSNETEAERWQRMRKWVEKNILPAAP